MGFGALWLQLPRYGNNPCVLSTFGSCRRVALFGAGSGTTESPWSMDVVEQGAGGGRGYAERNARRPAAAKRGAATAAWSAPAPALEPLRAR